jgi:cob(I)alamin adenosyltransferase
MQVKKVNQISSKNGDKGSSKDYSSRSFKKDNILFETLGTIDELSSFLGLAYHHTNYEAIINVQKTLQQINSLIATNPKSEIYNKLEPLNVEQIKWLEDVMQSILDQHPLEPRFTLPGSEKTLNGAYLDVCRAITRRAERRLVEFIETHARNDLENVQIYINRLSDFLFILSCNL